MNEDPRHRFPLPSDTNPAVDGRIARDSMNHALEPARWRRAEVDDEVDLLDIFNTIWRRKWVVVLFAIIAMTAGGYYAFEVANSRYSATTRLALDHRDGEVVDLETVISGISTDQSAINTETHVVKSRNLIERLVADMSLINDPEFNRTLREPSVMASIARYLSLPFMQAPELTPAEIHIEMVNKVTDAINVFSERDTYLIDIQAISGDPHKSADMVNNLAQIYLDDQIGIKLAATEYAIDWLSGRLVELEFELREKENEVTVLQAETKFVSVDAFEVQRFELHIRAKEIRDRLTSAEDAVVLTRGESERLRALAAGGDIGAMASAVDDPELNQLLDAALTGDESRRTAFLARFDEIAQREQLNAEREISKRDTLQTSFDKIQEQIEARNADLAELNQLLREAEATKLVYETFLARLKETSVQIGLQEADSRVLSVAPPGELVRPRKAMIMMLSLVLGAMAGVCVVLLRQFVHEGFRTAEELEDVTGYKVIGQIPRIPIRKRKFLLDYLKRKSTSAASEAVRNLRTSVLLSNDNDPPRVIMGVSTVPGEGKTTQAIALSLNLSDLGKKVLLVEADIRRRTFTNYFNQNPPGTLVSVLSDGQAIEKAVFHDNDVGADILMGGRSAINAADLFSSEKFSDFVESARAIYDFVIIDTPPVLVVPDARIIGRSVDAIIYTVKWDGTEQSQVVDGLRALSSVGLRISGLVLNQIDPAKMKSYGYGGKHGAYARYGYTSYGN